MRNTKVVTGRIDSIKRLKSSRNGNPRFVVSIRGHGMYATQPDSYLGYAVQNFRDGEKVTATVGTYYGRDSLEDIERAK